MSAWNSPRWWGPEEIRRVLQFTDLIEPVSLALQQASAGEIASDLIVMSRVRGRWTAMSM